MSIIDQYAARAKNRAACRAVADKILEFAMQQLDTVEPYQQIQVLNMVLSEIQIATKKDP
jgi:hypothetical protein